VTEKELKSLIDKTILPACKGVLYGKGRAYSGVRKAKDCLANFKRGALLTGLKVEQVCFIYLAKHFDELLLGQEVSIKMIQRVLRVELLMQ